MKQSELRKIIKEEIHNFYVSKANILTEIKIPEYISSELLAKDYNLTTRDMNHLSVIAGIHLQSFFKQNKVRFPGANFDIRLLSNDEIALIPTTKGKYNIRVNSKTNPIYLDNVTKAFQEGLIDYLTKNKS